MSESNNEVIPPIPAQAETTSEQTGQSGHRSERERLANSEEVFNELAVIMYEALGNNPEFIQAAKLAVLQGNRSPETIFPYKDHLYSYVTVNRKDPNQKLDSANMLHPTLTREEERIIRRRPIGQKPTDPHNPWEETLVMGMDYHVPKGLGRLDHPVNHKFEFQKKGDESPNYNNKIVVDAALQMARDLGYQSQQSSALQPPQTQ